MKLWLASKCLWWLMPLGVVCYLGGMAVLIPLTSALGDAPFWLLVVLLMVGGFRIKRWADATVSWHESVKRLR